MLTEEEAEGLRKSDAFPDWYSHDQSPLEYKAANWGWTTTGALVAVDYI
jgi:hypothetical protein